MGQKGEFYFNFFCWYFFSQNTSIFFPLTKEVERLLTNVSGLAHYLHESRTSSTQPRFVHNESGRFESRFSAVKVVEGTPAEKVWFDGMGGSILGVWVAHGEGRVFFPDSRDADAVAANNLAPLAYVDDRGNPTEAYPMNPNGSVGGLTSLCSQDGRHLAMMPHPERCFTSWQQPWTPPTWKGALAGPWLRMFQNVRSWCDKAQ